MGVVTSIFSRDATPLAEDPLGGEGRADDLSFLLFRLKDMGEDVTPASGVDSRPHRERVFVQACHQALGSPGVGPDGRGGDRHRSHGKSDTGYGAFRARRAQQNDPGLVASAHHTVRDESYAYGVPGVPRKAQGRAGVSGPSHCRDMATRRLPMRRTRTGLATHHSITGKRGPSTRNPRHSRPRISGHRLRVHRQYRSARHQWLHRAHDAAPGPWQDAWRRTPGRERRLHFHHDRRSYPAVRGEHPLLSPSGGSAS